jgi:hypothetical protein
MRIFAVLALFVCSQQVGPAQETTAAAGSDELIEVSAFAVRLDAEASQLKARKDLCVAIDTRLKINEQDIVSKLRAGGLGTHPHEWCNHGPRGFSFLLSAPIKRTVNGDYEVKIELGDLKIKPGEHFATILKEGVYRLKFAKGSQPEFISYQKTCCPRTE